MSEVQMSKKQAKQQLVDAAMELDDDVYINDVFYTDNKDLCVVRFNTTKWERFIKKVAAYNEARNRDDSNPDS